MADESLSTTVLDEEPVHFEVFEEGSKRGKPLLVGSDCFRYYIQKNQKNSVLWTCSARSSTVKCYATVVQKGGSFIRGNNSHPHAPDPSLCEKVQVHLQVRKEAKPHVYKSATELVNTALQEHMQPNQPGLPVPASIARAANQYRSKFRPAEPTDLQFEANNDYLQCQDFLVADVISDDARHMIFATKEQLDLHQTVVP